MVETYNGGENTYSGGRNEQKHYKIKTSLSVPEGYCRAGQSLCSRHLWYTRLGWELQATGYGLRNGCWRKFTSWRPGPLVLLVPLGEVYQALCWNEVSICSGLQRTLFPSYRTSQSPLALGQHVAWHRAAGLRVFPSHVGTWEPREDRMALSASWGTPGVIGRWEKGGSPVPCDLLSR